MELPKKGVYKDKTALKWDHIEQLFYGEMVSQNISLLFVVNKGNMKKEIGNEVS